MAEQQILSDNRFGMITYRPQISYPSLVDDFLNILLPKIKLLSSHYVWAIEKDGTPDRHCHLVFSVSDKENESQKVKQKFIEFKQMKDFLSHAKTQCMCGPEQLQCVLLKNDALHHGEKIGYCLKENPLQREFTFSSKIITQCVKFHWSSVKTQILVTDDWDLLTSKNVYTKLPHILKESNIDLTGDEILYFLSTQSVAYANISTKQLKTACLQLKIKQEFKGEKNLLKLHQLKLQSNDHAEWEPESLNKNDSQNPWISKYMGLQKASNEKIEALEQKIKNLQSKNFCYCHNKEGVWSNYKCRSKACPLYKKPNNNISLAPD